MRSNLSFINVYKKASTKSGIVTQLLYGDTFRKIKEKKSWIRIKNDTDGYKGFIKKKKFPSNQKNTHKVSKLCASLYLKPSAKNKLKKKLSFGSKIKVIKEKNFFYKFDNMWIKKADLKKISYKAKNIFKGINKFENTKYKWGGKHYTGVDCSGLIQLFFNFNKKFCPRDTKDQIIFFKKRIRLNKVRKNDLIFWKGHVALALSKNTLIHGYGPSKRVVTMPIKKTIDIIYKTANLKLAGVRRVI